MRLDDTTDTPSRQTGHDALDRIEHYWRGLAPDSGLPERAAVDPRGLEGALAHAFILERVARGIARFRVAGQHVCAMMGMDVRGMPLSALAVPALRSEIGLRLEEVFEGPTLMRLDYGLAAGAQRGDDAAAMILLPLLDRDGRVTRCLGGFVAEGSTQEPRRLVALYGVVRRERLATGPGVYAPAIHSARGDQVQGFSEPSSAFRTSGHPYLRLVKG